jgi:hypothetical protein
MVRNDLAKEYVVFFKGRLPEVAWQLMSALGVIFALRFYDWRMARCLFSCCVSCFIRLKSLSKESLSLPGEKSFMTVGKIHINFLNNGMY